VRLGSATLARSQLVLAQQQRTPDLCWTLPPDSEEHSSWTMEGEHIGKFIEKRQSSQGRQGGVQGFYISTPEHCSISMLIRCTERSILIGCVHSVLTGYSL
jgi:hypothetical protein